MRTSTRSPRPTRALSPWAAMVASRCSVVIAKPSGSSPSVPMRAADVEQHAAAGDPAGDGLDAGDLVAVAGDDVARAAAVPGVAVVEDVAEAVPLGGGLQRHEDHVVGAADPVREARLAALGVRARVDAWCAPGWSAAASPSAGRRSSKDWASEKLAPRRTRAAPSARLPASRKFSVPSTSSGAPAAPVRAPRRRGGDGALGVGAVEPAYGGRQDCSWLNILVHAHYCRLPSDIREDVVSDARYQLLFMPDWSGWTCARLT